MHIRLLALWVAAVFSIATLNPVASQSVQPAAGPPIEISDMHAGRMLLMAGRLRDARAFLEQARPQNEKAEIERLFLLGQIELRLGMPKSAATRFETILAFRPELARVRLELARTYFAIGRDERAKHHFEATLATRLPASVEDAVKGFLGRIDARRRLSASVSAAMLPETKSSGGTTSLGGFQFTSPETSSGIGMLVSGGASFSPALGKNLRAVLAASGAVKLYEQSDWNDISVEGEIGLARLYDDGSVSGGLRLGRRWLDGEANSRQIGPWVRGQFRLSDKTRLHVTASIEHKSHDRMGDRDKDGWHSAVSPSLTFAVDGRTSIRTKFELESVTARTSHLGSRMAGLGLVASRAFKGGLTLSSSASFHVRRHSAPNTLVNRVRTDKQIRLSTRVFHRALQYGEFVPHVGLSLERNNSNIPTLSYRNSGIIFGISRTF